MNWLTSIIPFQNAQALGWTLIHSLWQAGLVSLVISAFFAVFPQMTSRVKAAVSFSAVVLIGILVSATFILQMGSTSGSTLQNSSPAMTTNVLPLSVAGGPQPEFLALGSIGGFLSSQMPLVALMWLLGVAFTFTRLGFGVRQLWRIRREHHHLLPAVIQIRMRLLKERLSLICPVRLLATSRISSPIVYGHLRPVILFPLTLLSSVPLEQIEALLAHELAHIKRHDYLLNLLMRVFRALFFFNPGLLWLARVWENEREYACDQLATAIGVKPFCLAEALLGIRVQQQAWLGLTPAALGYGSLRKRIERIFGDQARRQSGFGTGLSLLLTLLFVGLLQVGASGLKHAAEISHGVESLAVQEASTPVAFPVVSGEKENEELKSLGAQMERLRLQIEALRLQKAGKNRDMELSRLEKKLTELAKVIVDRIPKPPLPPVAEVAPLAPVTPMKPIPPKAPELPEAIESVELSRVEEQLARQQEALERIEEALHKNKSLQLSEDQARLMEAQAQEEKAKMLSELKHVQAELDQRRRSELRNRDAELKLLEKEQKKMEAEHKAMALRQIEEEKAYREFEEKVAAYLVKHKLIASAADLNDLEITRDTVRLSGKELSKPHHRAILKMTESLFGGKMTDPNQRIVIQR